MGTIGTTNHPERLIMREARTTTTPAIHRTYYNKCGSPQEERISSRSGHTPQEIFRKSNVLVYATCKI